MKKQREPNYALLCNKIEVLIARVDYLSRMDEKVIKFIIDRNSVDETPIQKDILTTKEAAEYLGISRSTLYQLIKSSSLPYSQPERKIYFQRQMLDKWLLTNSKSLLLL